MNDTRARLAFSIPELQRSGFVGWLEFRNVRSALQEVDQAPGVYVVTCSDQKPASFLAQSRGGWFKGRDPSVSREQLLANWVDDSQVLYIGKGDNLRRRIREFADFGAGKPIGHWGGRLIWQLPEAATLLVAWKATPGRVAREVEAELIRSFREAYGKSPFANDPHLWGR